jgi:hypothetical protein
MNQEKKRHPSGQVEYLGRWVDKQNFRVFVYNEKEQRLASSYEEFINLTSSGLWFESKEAALNAKNLEKKTQKSKNSAKEQFKNAVNGNLNIGLN